MLENFGNLNESIQTGCWQKKKKIDPKLLKSTKSGKWKANPYSPSKTCQTKNGSSNMLWRYLCLHDGKQNTCNFIKIIMFDLVPNC